MTSGGDEHSGEAVVEGFGGDDFGGGEADDGGEHEGNDVGVVAGHFQDDDERGHRRLDDAGEVAGHAEDDSEAGEAASGEAGDDAAQAGADGQRRGEDAAGNSGEGAGEGGDKFGGPKGPGERVALHGAASLGVAGAEGGAVGEQAREGNDEAAGEREEQLAPSGLAGEPVAAEDGAVQQQAGEQAAGEAAKRTAGDDEDPAGEGCDGDGGDPEIGIIARQAQRGEAGKNDGVEDEAVGAVLERAAHFLDGEDDAGERGVEGGGDAGGGTGEDEPTLVAQAAELGDLQHDGGADLDGGAFAADRGAAEQTDDGEADFAGDEFGGQQQAALAAGREFAGGNGLRDAAALGAVEPGLYSPGAEDEAGGGDEEGNGPELPCGVVEAALRQVGGVGEEDADEADGDRAGPKDQAAAPDEF